MCYLKSSVIFLVPNDMLQRKKMFRNWGGKIISELTCVVSQACQLKSVLIVVWSWCESLFSSTPFSRVIASCTCWKLSGLWHHPSSHHHSFPGNRHWKVNSLTVGRHTRHIKGQTENLTRTQWHNWLNDTLGMGIWKRHAERAGPPVI